MALGDETEALKHIQNAEQNLTHGSRTYLRGGTELRSQASLSSSMSKGERGDAGQDLGAQDSHILQTVIELSNTILHKMRLNYNNLFTFAKARPLVHVKRSEIVPVDESTSVDFNVRPMV